MSAQRDQYSPICAGHLAGVEGWQPESFPPLRQLHCNWQVAGVESHVHAARRAALAALLQIHAGVSAITIRFANVLARRRTARYALIMYRHKT